MYRQVAVEVSNRNNNDIIIITCPYDSRTMANKRL